MVPMRDGVRLATDVHRNPKIESAPVILVRTPYDKNRATKTAQRFVEAGYVAVIQDSRGTHASEGVMIPYNGEGQDGYDAIEWIGQQAWCNGRIGMWGGSYLGAVQWQAAVEQPPGLVTITPTATWSNFYRNLYLGGALRLELITRWAAGTSAKPEGSTPPNNWDEVFLHLPLSQMDKKIGWPIPWLTGIYEHPEPNGYWTRLDLTERLIELELPIQYIVGYYDFFSRETVNSFVRMQQHARNPATRTQQQLILGPWDHGTIGKSKVGEIDFGPEAEWDTIAANIEWFDRFLKEKTNAQTRPFSPVRYFVMGENVWRDSEIWPPSGFQPTSFYLRSAGNANTRRGDGYLTTSPPEAEEAADTFRADPSDPAPAGPVNKERPRSAAIWGPVDQRSIEDRSDVLVYTSALQTEPLTCAGNAEASLFVSADTRDADWVVKLVDIHVDGFSQNLATGILRGRYRESELRPKPLQPGAVYEITIDLGPIAATIGKGHRMQIDVSGAYFPLFDRNPNTGDGPTGTRTLVATEKVYHGPGRPSRVILPCKPKAK